MAMAGADYEDYVAAVEPVAEHPFFQKLEALGGSVRYARDEYQEMQSSRTLLSSADTFLPAVTVPVLALYGEKDSEVDWQESVRIYRDSFARSGNQDLTIQVFEDANHTLCRASTGSLDERLALDRCERPDGFGETITSWLREHGFVGE